MPVDYREEPCKAALNRVRGMGFDWSLNPYVGCAHRCAFCYVRAFERRADRPADERYGWSIRVKVNFERVLRSELARRSWKRDQVVIGAATDPYQPCEGKYRLTRGCIAALGDARSPFGIITRGPMVVRDIDVLQHAARRTRVSVQFSIPTLDPEVWEATEPGTAPPRQRLRALRMLIDAGIDAGVAMAPILPGVSDRPDQLEAVIRAARDAGATRVWAGLLYLRPGTREHFLETLEQHWPDERARYEALYQGRAYLPRNHGQALAERVRAMRAHHGIRDRRERPLAPPPEAVQLDLAM